MRVAEFPKESRAGGGVVRTGGKLKEAGLKVHRNVKAAGSLRAAVNDVRAGNLLKGALLCGAVKIMIVVVLFNNNSLPLWNSIISRTRQI